MMLPPEPLQTTHYDSTLKCLCHCREFLDGRCDTEQLQARLKQYIQLNNSPLVSALTIIECEEESNSCKSKNEESIKRLYDAVKDSCCGNTGLSQFMDIQTLDAIHLVSSADGFKQKFVKLKTRMFYKQQKFNLFREESEGFAKLITLLLDLKAPFPDITDLTDACRSLIGSFNLDPNRVLDVILEAMESKPDATLILCELLTSFNADRTLLSHILGFKISTRSQHENAENYTFRVAAQLAKHDLLSIEHLLGHLRPSEVTGEKDKTKTSVDDSNLLTFLTELVLSADQSKLAIQLLSVFPTTSGCECIGLASAFCDCVEQSIHPLYRLCSHITVPLYATLEDGHASTVNRKSVNNWQLFNEHICPILNVLGPQLSISLSAFIKIVRITGYFLSNKTESQDRDYKLFLRRLERLVVTCLLPSLSLLEYNEPASIELWESIRFINFRKRYRIYTDWMAHSEQKTTQQLQTTHEQVLTRSRYIFNRITIENVRNYSRQIARLSHCNPAVVCQYIVDSILRYDNFIVPVVDALKYLSPLAYDVLVYRVITSLANPNNQRLKHDGACFSRWMRSLTLFGSSILRKYPIEITGIIQHIIDQLDAGQPSDLLFLQQILHKMCGIEVVHDMTEHQLGCLAGGSTLFSEGAYYSVSRNVHKSMNRFRDYLLGNNFVFKLCVKIGQQRNNLPFVLSAEHSKMVGYLYDQCQNTLVQLLNFLRASTTEKEHAAIFPSISDLLSTHRLGVDIAFMLTYRTHQYNIQELLLSCANRNAEKSQKEDQAAGDDSPTKKYRLQLANEICKLNSAGFCGPRILKECNYDSFCNSPLFFATFWTCSMYDIQCPIEAYEKQRQNFQDLVNKIEDQRDSEASKFAKEHERYQMLIEQLNKEEREHKEHTDRFIEELERQKTDWFSKDIKFRAEIITEFLHQCIYPRCTLSELDSLLCARYIHLMHKLKIPEFTTIICYDRIFMNIILMIASCTECEADRFGRFLSTLFETVMYWHSNRQVYEKECLNYPGFLTSFRYSLNTSNSTHKEEKLTYENYRHVCHKWHYQMTVCFIECLESAEYIQIRNSLKILTRLLPHYPRVIGMYYALEKRVDRLRLSEKDSRKDLATLATVYWGQLKTRQSQMIEEFQFHSKGAQTVSGHHSGAEDKSSTSLLADTSGTSSQAVNEPSRKSTEALGNDKTISVSQSDPPSASLGHHSSDKRGDCVISRTSAGTNEVTITNHGVRSVNTQGESTKSAEPGSVSNGKVTYKEGTSRTLKVDSKQSPVTGAGRKDVSLSTVDTNASIVDDKTDQRVLTSRDRKRQETELSSEERRRKRLKEEILQPPSAVIGKAGGSGSGGNGDSNPFKKARSRDLNKESHSLPSRDPSPYQYQHHHPSRSSRHYQR